jgi:hypothetical protein
LLRFSLFANGGKRRTRGTAAVAFANNRDAESANPAQIPNFREVNDG